ncbi:MAG: hypothetical protein HDR09_20065 [Lachnospiraceae bacterium]|nr:hypothetical protein [Lachnospiraceae bacterium]MBD5505971.1 hypothetical protein [Lachnospiraceae bacterium]
MDIRKYIEKETGIPTAEVAFTKPQKLPFIAVIDRTDEDGDDYHAQIVSHDLTVELYADRIDPESERKLEAAFAKQAWKVTKDRTWISSEKMFETIYSTNFKEKR